MKLPQRSSARVGAHPVVIKKFKKTLARVRPAGAYYHRELGEFILPYDAVRTLQSPAGAIRDFVDSTYDAAATLAGWDRAALERPRPFDTTRAKDA